VYPPLRTKEDQAALIDAVQRGVIDCISSHHQPQDWDGKTIEFEYAKAGIASIETSFATILQVLPNLTSEAIANLFSNNARQIFNLPSKTIQEGQPIELTLFNCQSSSTYSKAHSKSKSANSPFWEKNLKGKVIGTYSKGHLHLNSQA
jgi:dihydroorotase